MENLESLSHRPTSLASRSLMSLALCKILILISKTPPMSVHLSCVIDISCEYYESDQERYPIVDMWRLTYPLTGAAHHCAVTDMSHSLNIE